MRRTGELVACGDATIDVIAEGRGPLVAEVVEAIVAWMRKLPR